MIRLKSKKFVLLLTVILTTIVVLSSSAYGLTLWLVVKGTSGNDNLTGTKVGDAIYGLGGDDKIMALGGNDLLYGGNGNDHLEPNQGIDIVYGEAGNDMLNSYAGTDTLYGGLGDDNFVIHPTIHKTIIKPDNKGNNKISINYVFTKPIGKIVDGDLIFKYLSFDKSGYTYVLVEDYKTLGKYKIDYRQVTYN